ncbi:MAG: type IV secretion protein IcmD [Gammaproteobacteria bacterium]|nr:type IV secretion protein IcmD [Gammaproteobacteria bacterium]
MNKLKARVIIFITFTLPVIIYAQGGSSSSPGGIDKLFNNITGSLGAVAAAILSISFIAGLGFGVASIFKFKQHKDNPNQTPLGQPMALLGIAVMLIWLPFLLQSLGATITGGDSKSGKSGIDQKPPEWVTTSGSTTGS